MKMSDPRSYPARRLYQIFALIGVLMALLFGWELTRAFDWVILFFLGASALFAMVNLRWAQMRLELTPSGLTIHQPFVDSVHLDFRQMVDVVEAGRTQLGISLVYYPLNGQGLVDMNQPRTLFLPAVENQEELLGVLQQEIPT